MDPMSALGMFLCFKLLGRGMNIIRKGKNIVAVHFCFPVYISYVRQDNLRTLTALAKRYRICSLSANPTMSRYFTDSGICHSCPGRGFGGCILESTFNTVPERYPTTTSGSATYGTFVVTPLRLLRALLFANVVNNPVPGR